MLPSPPRRRVLFVAEAVTLAHVARARALAGTLDPSRFEVHAAWDPRYNHVLGPLPFAFHPIRSLPTELFLRRLARGLPMHDRQTLRAYVAEDVSLIRAVGPDLVVSDFRLSLAASARAARTPLLTIANAYWSPFARQTFLFDEYDYPLSRLLGNRAARTLFRLLRPVGFAAHTRPLNQVLREQGLPGIGHDIRVMYTWGDFTAYVDIPGLADLQDLPANHRYVGAVLWSPAIPRPDWWDQLPPDRPVVYVTPGSSGDGDLLPATVDALADLPVTVVVSTAGRAQPPRPPSNARFADFLPGSEAAARAALVVCNGGSATTYQALAAGVPVLGIVGNNMDQHLNMEAVRRAGAGEVLRARGVTSGSIRALSARMLETVRYRDAAARLARAHRACPAERRFPELVEEAIGTLHRAGSPGAPGR